MKTRLLILTGVLFVFFTSCSTDNERVESSKNDTTIVVQKLYDSFSKSVIGTPSFSELIQKVKTKSFEGLTSKEIKQLEQEFLNEQNDQFVELYNHIVALDLPIELMSAIMLEYQSSIAVDGVLEVRKNGSKDRSDDCAAIEAAASESYIFAIAAVVWC